MDQVNCPVAQTRLSAYLDRELPGDEMLAVRDHLSVCYDCERELDALRAIKGRLSTMSQSKPPEGFVEGLMDAVGAQSARPEPVRLGAMLATSVAAAIVALLVFNAFFRGESDAQYAREQAGFDATRDTAVTSPDFGGHAPLIPVGR